MEELSPRQIEFLRLYNDPKSETFGNALQSALKAGYSQEYAENITSLFPDWLKKGKSLTMKELEQIKPIIKKNVWLNIYFIKDNLTNLVKIGIAENVKKRFGQIKCHCSSNDLEFMGILAGSNKDIRVIEKDLHRVFKRFNHHGEWFKLNPFLESFIREFTAYV